MHSKNQISSVVSRWMILTLSSVCIAIVWCQVLPWFATTPAMHKQLQFLDEREIDPSAMFYTEMDAMDKILIDIGVR